ncbi:hypothetical protein [Bifidobacterium simiiventris]|uniref:hypothetical protein n=1 Tax=Bifidobacterium simiiventris TaxID=2834434 RepID=UPI001C56387B|nr:hypothetical protein [Bifidobacterium simiiventris]MBW3079666.1 hypothetical protein [Bifidobacterium simiiventris]
MAGRGYSRYLKERIDLLGEEVELLRDKVGSFSKVSKIDFASLIISLVALVLSAIAFVWSIQAWNDEGANFVIKPLSDSTLGTSTYKENRKQYSQQMEPVILTNTGRTQGTVVMVDRQNDDVEMEACIPNMNDDGLSMPDELSHALLSNRQITLQPGESRLIFFTEKGNPIPEGGNVDTQITMGDGPVIYRLYRADGTFVKVEPSGVISESVREHYEKMLGYDNVLLGCIQNSQSSE